MSRTSEEIREIQSIADLDTLLRKRSGRKTQITKLASQIENLESLPLEKLSTKEVQKRTKDLQRSIRLYEAIQKRIECLLLAEQPDTLAEEEANGIAALEDNEVIEEKAETLYDKVTLQKEFAIILDDLTPLMEAENPDQPIYQTTFADLKKQITEFKRKAGEYLSDPCISKLVSNLNTAVTKFQKKAAEAYKATAAASFRSSTPALSVSPISDPTESTRTMPVLSRLRLDLPKFNGEPTEWLGFKALFTAAIERDGARISDHEKCIHLLSCLTTNGAKQTVKQFSTNPNGFALALQALEDVYGGAWRIYPQHVAALIKPDTYSYTSESLRKMRELIDSNIKGLEQCGGNTLEQFLAAVIISRFDKNMLYEWTHHWEDLKTLPTVTNVRDFFRKRELRMIEQPSALKNSHATNKSNQPPAKSATSNKKVNLPVRAVTGTETNRTEPNHTESSNTYQPFQCVACGQGGHSLARCSTFNSWNVDQRQEAVRKANFCFNCLSNKHLMKDCKSSFTCRLCNTKHHTLLHKDTTTTNDRANTTNTRPTPETPNDGGVMVTYGGGNSVVLSTALFICRNGAIQQQGRALLDSGSAPSLITEALASALQLPRRADAKSFTCATGKLLQSKHSVTIELLPIFHTEPQESITVTCHIVRQLPSTVPPANPEQLIKQQQDLGRQPPADSSLGGNIDILLGVSDSSRCHVGSRIYTPDKAGYVAPTTFGWIYGGQLPGAPSNQTVLIIQPSLDPLEVSLARLHEMDKVEPLPTHFTPEEKKAVEHFNDNHYRLPSGRFVVSLPRKEDPPTLGTSRPTALRRFLRNERSLVATGQLPKFESVLKEYLDLGHAELIPFDQLSSPPNCSYYLPVHGVVKQSSTTTKLRAVFDASCKTSTGISLNDTLLSGPNLYPLLSTVLNRFRMFPVAMTADIGKMFREVELHPDDRDYHRFLMRDPSSGAITDHRMTRLTFGVTTSPYLATQVLLELANQEQERYPEAAAAIRQLFYVDDCLAGASTVEEAKHLGKQLIDLLDLAGMQLRKFRSNSADFLQSIPSELRETEDLEISTPSTSAKTLGIHWRVQPDTFHVSTPTIDSDLPVTKRLVASAVAKVYDVLGLFAPVTIVARMVLQQLWVSGLDWDEPVPEDLNLLWHTWTSSLPELTAHPVPRNLLTLTTVICLQLHGFSDASEKAYGAAIYVRAVYSDATTSTRLVMAKARVAPVKVLTIPKLELSASLLLAKLLHLVSTDLNIPIAHQYAWTDSAIVLCWLNHAPNRLQTYQANRVAAITELVPPGQWRHVRSASNPADLASRGTSVTNLLDSSLWWEGPAWLKLSPEEWPHLVLSYPDNPSGLKATVINTVAESSPWNLWSKYSSFSKLVRIIAWLKRFLNNTRSTSSDRIRSWQLISEELSTARNVIIRTAQHQSFPEVLKTGSKDLQLPKGHQLSHYDVKINPLGLLEIRGRVKQTDGRPRSYLPLKLNSPITKLLISSLHQSYHHPSTSTLLGILSEQYHIPGLRNHLKQLGRKCVTCQKTLGSPQNQRMGMLPHHRTTPNRPFSISGVDFAGPFLVHRGNPRKPTRIKTYCAVFVCFCTRALHFELCADLSSEAFVAAFRRFTSRRGVPRHLYSDGGSNFVGARRDMKETQALLQNSTTINHLNELTCNHDFQWHFSPPRAPHFGGLWEAGVKSMKQLLKRNLSSTPLAYDELETILIEMEGILNSRPITPITSTDPDSLEMLTASHFLTGGSLNSPPPTHVDTSSKITLLRRWNLVQRLTHDLWKRWKASYLQSLVARQKWHKKRRNYLPGDVVLLKDDSFELTRNWPMAIITSTHPGPDGLVRVVDLRCRGKQYRRSVDRLILLIPQDEPLSSSSSPPGGCLGSTQSGRSQDNCLSEPPPPWKKN